MIPDLPSWAVYAILGVIAALVIFALCDFIGQLKRVGDAQEEIERRLNHIEDRLAEGDEPTDFQFENNMVHDDIDYGSHAPGTNPEGISLDELVRRAAA